MVRILKFLRYEADQDTEVVMERRGEESVSRSICALDD